MRLPETVALVQLDYGLQNESEVSTDFKILRHLPILTSNRSMRTCGFPLVNVDFQHKYVISVQFFFFSCRYGNSRIVSAESHSLNG